MLYFYYYGTGSFIALTKNVFLFINKKREILLKSKFKRIANRQIGDDKHANRWSEHKVRCANTVGMLEEVEATNTCDGLSF